MKPGVYSAAIGVLAGGLALTGCTEGAELHPLVSSTVAKALPAWSDTTEPLWASTVYTNHQPQVVDGVVVASISDAEAVGGSAVVAWDASSGTELWRADGTGSFVHDVGGKDRVVYRIPGSVVLADPRTGEESHAAVPDAMVVSGVFRCSSGTRLCLTAFRDREQFRFSLDESSMTWAAAPEGRLRLGDGVTMSEAGVVLSAHFSGDTAQAGWTRSFDDMFGPHSGWERAYGFNWWEWLGDREVLLGTALLENGEFVSGGFAHDGTTLWTMPGRPCDEIWTSNPIQVMCQDSGTRPLRSWIAVDVRTGEQEWRFPEDGTGVIVPDHGSTRFAKIQDDRYVQVWAGNSPYLVEVATGKTETLEGVFLCSMYRAQDNEAFLADSDLLQTCDSDTDPIEAPWPTRWVQLAGASDGNGFRAIATADQIVVFQF